MVFGVQSKKDSQEMPSFSSPAVSWRSKACPVVPQGVSKYSAIIDGMPAATRPAAACNVDPTPA